VKLLYSAEAIADLRRLRAFIATENPAAAARISAELMARISRLVDFPGMGRCVDMAPTPESVRDFIFDSYVVRYAPQSSAIVILRIWHQFESRSKPQ